MREGACSTGTTVDCVDVSGNGGETIAFTAPANTNYWVFVDGSYGEIGTYQLEVKVTP